MAQPSEKLARTADRMCRASFHERMVERMLLIQKRLDAERAELERRVKVSAGGGAAAGAAPGDDEEERLARFCAEARGRIANLEQRLARQERAATARMAELDVRLRRDPRLAALYVPAQPDG